MSSKSDITTKNVRKPKFPELPPKYRYGLTKLLYVLRATYWTCFPFYSVPPGSCAIKRKRCEEIDSTLSWKRWGPWSQSSATSKCKKTWDNPTFPSKIYPFFLGRKTKTDKTRVNILRLAASYLRVSQCESPSLTWSLNFGENVTIRIISVFPGDTTEHLLSPSNPLDDEGVSHLEVRKHR